MNNQPYHPQYTAGQQGQGYYASNGQPVPNQQMYPSYPSHGVQTFQNHGYLPQPQQSGYPPNHNYQYQPPRQPHNSYQYNTSMVTQAPIDRVQIQPPIQHQVPHYDGSYSSRASQDSRNQLPPNHIPSPQMRMPTQSPMQQQPFAPPHSQPHFQRRQHSPQVQMHASPVQAQHQPQQPPMSMPQVLPQARISPPYPQPSPKIHPGQTKPLSQQRKQSTASPKPAQKPSPQAVIPGPKPVKPLQQHKTPTNIKPMRPPSAQDAKVSSVQTGRPNSHAEQQPPESLVLALAEEYLQAAAKLKRDSGKDHPTEEYFDLISIGLTSLKAVLTTLRPKPAVEAAVRLRYASVLFEETSGDYLDIEETLSNGISVCDRNRLFDAKYHMVHLLVRCIFRSKPKAALKYLDERIREVEMARHVAWIYAFRLLRASLSMQTKQQQEIFNAITQLKLVSDKAADRGDRAISAFAAVMEAHIHISRNNTSESIEQAQRALAVVRSLQETPEASTVPQLEIMAGFVDVACCMYQADTAQASKVMKATHDELDKLTTSPIWSSGGEIHIPLAKVEPTTAPGSESRSSGAVHGNDRGGLSLSVSWLDKDQIYGLGFMLHAITRHHKNASDDAARSEKLLQESKEMFSASDAREPSEQNAYSRRALHVLLLVNKVFEQCSRNRWADAKAFLQDLSQQIKTLPEMPGAPWQALCHYLEGVTQQATGNMDVALKAYHHESLALPQGSEYRTPYQRELALLATMNSLLIIRTPGHPLHKTYSNTLAALEPLARVSASKNIFSAEKLVRAAMPDLQVNVSILDTKAFLQTALQAAKQTSNNQLMCITLNILSYKFFRGVVGEQAEKSGRATQTLARRGKDSLWLSVADGALAETLEAQGKTTEAQATWKEAVDLASRLPKNMRGVMVEKTPAAASGEFDWGPMELTDQFAM